MELYLCQINNLKVKKKTKELTAYLGAPHIPPIKKKGAKEQLIENMENPLLEEISASENPLIAMAEFQGAVIGTYVNKLEHNKVKQAKKIGQLKHTLDTITKEKVELEKKKNLQSEKIKQMEVRLLQSKDTITQFKPKNVKQSEETKQKQLEIMKDKKNIIGKRTNNKNKTDQYLTGIFETNESKA